MYLENRHFHVIPTLIILLKRRLSLFSGRAQSVQHTLFSNCLNKYAFQYVQESIFQRIQRTI